MTVGYYRLPGVHQNTAKMSTVCTTQRRILVLHLTTSGGGLHVTGIIETLFWSSKLYFGHRNFRPGQTRLTCPSKDQQYLLIAIVCVVETSHTTLRHNNRLVKFKHSSFDLPCPLAE